MSTFEFRADRLPVHFGTFWDRIGTADFESQKAAPNAHSAHIASYDVAHGGRAGGMSTTTAA